MSKYLLEQGNNQKMTLLCCSLEKTTLMSDQHVTINNIREDLISLTSRSQYLSCVFELWPESKGHMTSFHCVHVIYPPTAALQHNILTESCIITHLLSNDL